MLPEPGTLTDPELEATARSRDLALLQLANEGEMEVCSLISMVERVRDSMGRLVIAKELRTSGNMVAALVVKYQPGHPNHRE